MPNQKIVVEISADAPMLGIIRRIKLAFENDCYPKTIKLLPIQSPGVFVPKWAYTILITELKACRKSRKYTNAGVDARINEALKEVKVL